MGVEKKMRNPRTFTFISKKEEKKSEKQAFTHNIVRHRLGLKRMKEV